MATTLLAFDNTNILVEQAVNHIYQQRYLDAHRVLKAAYERSPRHPGVHFNLGRLFEQTGNFEEALKEYSLAASLDNAMVAARRGIARCTVELKRLQAERPVSPMVSTQEPRQQGTAVGTQGAPTTFQKINEPVAPVVTQIYTSTNELQLPDLPARVVKAASKVTEEDKAEQLLNGGKTAEARLLLDKILEKNPDSPKGHYLMGKAMMEAGSMFPAISHLEEALRVDERFYEAYYLLGQSYGKVNLLEDALKNFLAYYAVRPQGGVATEIGRVYEAMGNSSKANEFYGRANAMNPGNAGLQMRMSETAGNLANELYLRGNHAFSMNQFREAYDLLRQALDTGSLADGAQRDAQQKLEMARFRLMEQVQRTAAARAGYTQTQRNYGVGTLKYYQLSDAGLRSSWSHGLMLEWRGYVVRRFKKYGREMVLMIKELDRDEMDVMNFPENSYKLNKHYNNQPLFILEAKDGFPSFVRAGRMLTFNGKLEWQYYDILNDVSSNVTLPVIEYVSGYPDQQGR